MRTILACLSFTAVVTAMLAVPAGAAEPHKDRCVVLVSVDGLAGFYLDDPKADLPTLRRLAREGRGPRDWSARSPRSPGPTTRRS